MCGFVSYNGRAVICVIISRLLWERRPSSSLPSTLLIWFPAIHLWWSCFFRLPGLY